MSDLYSECLVKKESTPRDAAVKYGLIVLTVLFAAAGLFVTPILLLGAVGLGVACYFIIPRTDLEYEYLFVNGELDIDMIMSKSKRKKAKTVNLIDSDLIAPVDSRRMEYYNGNNRMKEFDYSSGKKENKKFAVIFREEGESCRLLFEPDEEMIQAIKKSAPNKVFLD